MQPLETVIVHLTSQRHTWREGAIPQRGEGASSGDLVDIADEEHVALIGRLLASQREQDLVEERVAREALEFPGVVFGDFVRGGGGREDAMDDFVVEGAEGGEVGLQVEVLRRHLECGGGFEDEEVVDLVGEFVEAQGEEVELGVDEEEVVDFAGAVPCRVGEPAAVLAEVLG